MTEATDGKIWDRVFEALEHPSVPAMAAILGKPFMVGSGGFVRVVDYMGNDASIVQAARVSYGKGTKKVSEDKALIRYLMRHSHTTPFEMCEIKLHIRIPMDIWRQWIRHRTASVNEYSTRYSEAIDEAATTPEDAWRLQAQGNRQGSDGLLGVSNESDGMGGKWFSDQERRFLDSARDLYQDRLAVGIAREQARKDLPLSTYTEAYWKIDLHNLLHFLKLRMDSHAQLEIRQYATTIFEKIVRVWVPDTAAAFEDYVLRAITLSVDEQKALRAMLYNEVPDVEWGSRERAEFEAKLSLIDPDN